MPLQINEIFYSIQGESTTAGLPTVFIRLTGCNLRCDYCDTRYAYEAGRMWSRSAIMDRLRRFGCSRVTVTGGEPLLQPQTPDLVRDLLDSGYQVGVETNGSYDIGCLDRRCTRVMDVKCPSSGMQAQNRLANFALLNPGDQIKFVIADRTDFQFACQTAEMLGRDFPSGDILFSAVHARLPAAELAKWMLADGIDARLQIQLHKYLWPDRDRGV